VVQHLCTLAFQLIFLQLRIKVQAYYHWLRAILLVDVVVVATCSWLQLRIKVQAYYHWLRAILLVDVVVVATCSWHTNRLGEEVCEFFQQMIQELLCL
jgi:hypothetical protein